MAFQAKFTAAYGRGDLEDVALAAGANEAQSDTISVNMDITNMGRAEALQKLQQIVAKIHAEAWPPVA